VKGALTSSMQKFILSRITKALQWSGIKHYSWQTEAIACSAYTMLFGSRMDKCVLPREKEDGR
jgi:hypothetical protein